MIFKPGKNSYFLTYPPKENNKPVSNNTRMEAGSNTSTVTLRVIGGDEKGSLESERVKYGHESYGTRTRK
jgi:hypothetical protein